MVEDSDGQNHRGRRQGTDRESRRDVAVASEDSRMRTRNEFPTDPTVHRVETRQTPDRTPETPQKRKIPQPWERLYSLPDTVLVSTRID